MTRGDVLTNAVQYTHTNGSQWFKGQFRNSEVYVAESDIQGQDCALSVTTDRALPPSASKSAGTAQAPVQSFYQCPLGTTSMYGACYDRAGNRQQPLAYQCPSGATLRGGMCYDEFGRSTLATIAEMAKSGSCPPGSTPTLSYLMTGNPANCSFNSTSAPDRPPGIYVGPGGISIKTW